MNEARRPASLRIRRGEARRRELLREAARIFLRDGLESTSMDMIAAEAGTSKATLYRHFGDRHGLVVQVVQFLCDDFLSDLDLSAAPGLSLRDGLHRVLLQLAHVLAKPDHPAFFRLIVAGTQRDPEIGRTWHENGPLRWHRRVREVFASRQAAGEIAADADYSEYPEILFDALFAGMIMRTAIIETEAEARIPQRFIDRLVDSVIAAISL